MSQGGFYDPNTYNQQGPTQYDMNLEPDGNEFGVFDYSEGQGQEPDYSQQPDQTFNQPQPGIYNPAAYSGNMYTPSDQHAYTQQTPGSGGDEDYENEPPLLEELGINFDHIYQKTLAVLNPLKNAEADVVQDSDLAGPLVFCLAFGATLLLAGKIQFGYIYGLGVFGSLGMYSLLNLMSMTGVSVTCVISILGYCLLPMVILSSAAILTVLSGALGSLLSGLTVMWCSFSASKLFVSALQMDGQQLLIAYPCALVYAVFALLTVF